MKGDILIHCGNFYRRDCDDPHLTELNAWFREQDFKYKLYIPGSSDLAIERIGNGFEYDAEQLSEADLLIDSGVTIEGIRFYGTPWVPSRIGHAFKIDQEYAEVFWDNIPVETDILITHVPPYRILDDSPNCRHKGCPYLRHRVFEAAPKFHVFGHISSGYGTKEENGIEFLNGSIFDPDDGTFRKPLEIELDNNSLKGARAMEATSQSLTFTQKAKIRNRITIALAQ